MNAPVNASGSASEVAQPIGGADPSWRVVRLHRPATPGETPALRFTLEDGAWAWLVGPPGSGKGAALDAIAAVRPLPGGQLEVFNRAVERLGRAERQALRRRIGVVTADFDPFAAFTVGDVASLPARAAGRPRREVAARTQEVLAWVGLKGQATRPARDLDREGAWRLALARALAAAPDLLLACSPGRDLAAPARQALIRLMQQAHAAGISVLVADVAPLEGGPAGSLIRVSPPQGAAA
ncbi:MAG: ATP-binding cassette domain-containing protein [Alphaproteobacteria bacterium]|nr:ATP-binding cassette domain-containing protein [Alphaproteobacteria bacterium]